MKKTTALFCALFFSIMTGTLMADWNSGILQGSRAATPVPTANPTSTPTQWAFPPGFTPVPSMSNGLHQGKHHHRKQATPLPTPTQVPAGATNLQMKMPGSK